MAKQTSPTADRELLIERTLNAPVELVWEVWTHPEHLRKWWGPEGFSNTIHKMDVQAGGEWLLVMHGPDGKDYPTQNIYREIIPLKKIVYEHISAPQFTTTVTFEARGQQTHIRWHMLFASREEFIEVVKKFQADEGLRQNIVKLNAYLEARLHLRHQLKTYTMARVSTYLNFPGTTEEAFLFYRSVFGGDFTGNGIVRFGDNPPAEGMPPLSDTDKKLVLHIELPILGGHILMGTDAPESMGFSVTTGNTMHINLEPDTRAEARRIFEALSAGGKITMPLQDMFWGAYFGSFTDRYGINWMVNCTEKS